MKYLAGSARKDRRRGRVHAPAFGRVQPAAGRAPMGGRAGSGHKRQGQMGTTRYGHRAGFCTITPSSATRNGWCWSCFSEAIARRVARHVPRSPVARSGAPDGHREYGPVEGGADPNAKNESADTPLRTAIDFSSGCPNTAERAFGARLLPLLLRHGARTDLRMGMPTCAPTMSMPRARCGSLLEDAKRRYQPRSK